MMKKVNHIAKHRTTAFPMLLIRGSTPAYVKHLYDMSSYVIRSDHLQEQARKQIALAFKQLFHIPISTKITLSLPAFLGRDKDLLNHLLLIS